jgi:hypothetical protein
MRRLRAILLVLLGCLTALGGLVVFAVPALAAYVCPFCYDFERTTNGIYLEAGHEGHAIMDAYHDARKRVEEGFNGAALPQTTILACYSEKCDLRIGLNGPRGRAYGSRFIVLASTADKTILAHELAHILIHDEVGALGLMRGDLPAWRDEGIAVLVSGDERYFNFEATSPACLVEPDGPLPVSPGQWGRAVGPDTHLSVYAQAACAVFRESGLPPYNPKTLLQGNG